MFKKNPLLQRQLKADPRYTARMMASAKEVQRFAEAVSPRIMRRNPQAFKSEPTREGARVSNTDYGGHLAELGSKNNPPYAPLRRGVRAAGLDLREQ